MIENTNIKQFYPGPILNNTLEITDFLFNDAEQIKIKHSKLNEEDILVDIDLNYPTDYEVTKVLPSDINAAEAALTASTGQIMLKNVNVLAGEKLTVYRVSQIIQDKDYPRTGAFPAATHEGALDYLTMQNQEQKDEIDRALKVPISTQNFEGSLPLPIPSRALKINNDGTGFEMSEFDPDLALVTTEEFKNQSQQAAAAALASQNVATEQAAIATEQATIATEQSELVASTANRALEDIDTLKTNTISELDTIVEESVETVSDLANEIANNAQNIINRLGVNLFDTKISDHILEGDEALGWALQGTYAHKEGVAGSRIGYADFYNRCVEEYENATEKAYLKSNVTYVGSVADNQGVLSGFSSSNYAKIQNYFSPSSNTWEVVLKAKLSSIPASGTSSIMLAGLTDSYISLEISSAGKIQFLIGNGSSWVVNTTVGTTVFQTNTDYWFKLGFNGTVYTVYSSTNGSDWTQEATATNSVSMSNVTLVIGISKLLNNSFLGAIDLKESYININGSRWWSGTTTVVKNPNGHKFYDISQKPYIDSIYESTGTADYYGIDTENERIFLPRNNKFWQFTTNTGEVNNYVEAGLPNITGKVGGIKDSTPDGAFYAEGGNFGGNTDTKAQQFAAAYIDASRSSSVYGNSDTVQPPSSLKLLYYCVGNTKVEEAITNVTEITTSENDTLPLFYNFYSQEDMTTTGAYVNASLGSWLSGNVYTTAYNELVNKLGTDNVKANTDTYTDYDFVVNQDDMTFRLPLFNGDRVLVEKKVVTSNDNTWYNLYSDGWCEQGGGGSFVAGNNSISLIKPSSINGAWATLNSGLYASSERNLYIGITGTYPNQTLELNTGSTQTEYVSWWCCGYAPSIPTNTGTNLYYKLSNAVTNLELLDVAKVTADLNTCYKRNAGDNSDLSGLAMPSNRYIDLTLGASGTTYTAPANGWVKFLFWNITRAGYLNIVARMELQNTVSYTGGSVNVYAPVSKGETFKCYYDVTGSNLLRFYYAEGEV